MGPALALLPMLGSAAAWAGRALMSPTGLGIIGTMLPSVVSALTGSATEEEAREKVAPQREEMLAKLVESGMDPAEAEKLADDSIATEVQRVMSEGGMPPWMEVGASVLGGFGGAKLGSILKGRRAAAASAPAMGEFIQGPFAGTGKMSVKESPFAAALNPEGKLNKRVVTGPEQAAAARSAPIEEREGEFIFGPFSGMKTKMRESPYASAVADAQSGVPKRNFDAADARGFSRKAPRLENDVIEPQVLERQPMLPSVPERGYQTSSSPTFTGGASPMTAEEVALWERQMAARRQPQRPMRSPDQPPEVLNIGEDPALAAGRSVQQEYLSPFPRGMRTGRVDPLTGRPKLPHEDLPIDPLTGAPIWGG